MGIHTRQRPRILFLAETVTLAHFARPLVLAQALDPGRYDIHLAADPRYRDLMEDTPHVSFMPIHSIPSARFTRALARGKPVYDQQTLARYAAEDIRLLEELRPDLVVGDFRLSLAVSAPATGIPYATITNAYWSPYARTRYPVPELPMVRLLGVSLGQRLFDIARPLAFALHARPLNRLRRRYGLPSLGHDVRAAYTWADYTLYAEIPEAVPMAPLPTSHRYLGPILWSTHCQTPDWWHALPTDRPVVYVTLGSSGQSELLPRILQALADSDVTVIASTAGKTRHRDQPANAFTADYLPGDLATRRASLVICNGGSLTTYQALAAGVPVIGIASNMDQLLNMQMLERMGAGITIRAGSARVDAIRSAAQAALEDSSWANAAGQAAELLAGHDAAQRFREIVAEILSA